MHPCSSVRLYFPSTSAWEINSFGAWSSRKLSNHKQLVWLVGGKLFNPVMTVVVWQGAVLDNYCRLLQRFKQEGEDCLQNKAIYWCLGNGLKVLLKDFVLCHFSRLFCCFCTISAEILGHYPVKVTPPPLISYKKEVSLKKQITSSTLTSRSCFSPLRENGTRGSFIAVYLSKTNKKRR